MSAVALDDVELRIRVPRAQLPAAPPPEYYSQLNCDQLGITRRIFLELLRKPGAPRPTKVGKLRLVKRAAMLDFLERLRELEPKAAAELDGADRVLMEIGAAPRARKRKTG